MFEKRRFPLGEAPVQFEISVPEAVDLFNKIHKQPKQLFDMIRVDVKESVGQYLTL